MFTSGHYTFLSDRSCQGTIWSAGNSLRKRLETRASEQRQYEITSECACNPLWVGRGVCNYNNNILFDCKPDWCNL